MKTLRPILTAALLGAGATGLLSLTGCGGPPRHRPPMSEEPSDNAAARPTLLQGEQPFFAGRVLARLIVTRSAGHGGPGGPEGGAPKHRPSGGGMMGGGAGGPPPGGGGGGMGGGGMGGPPPGGGDRGDESEPARPHLMGASGPGLRVQLQLIDQDPATAAPITVEIVDFQSVLGDFALKPDRLALAPGQTASPDAITSRMGVVAAEIPVQLTLRLAGQKEQQTVVLRAVAGNPPAPAAKPTQ